MRIGSFRYAAPGQITTIAFEPGERLAGTGLIAAGDTARWIIGDTESGAGRDTRVLVLVKPTRPDIGTNLVISTDRCTYLIELNASEETWMPAISWAYPRVPETPRVASNTPRIPPAHARNNRYGLQGDSPPWRPVSVFDDGRRVYIVLQAQLLQNLQTRKPSFRTCAGSNRNPTRQRRLDRCVCGSCAQGISERTSAGAKAAMATSVLCHAARAHPAPQAAGLPSPPTAGIVSCEPPI